MAFATAEDLMLALVSLLAAGHLVTSPMQRVDFQLVPAPLTQPLLPLASKADPTRPEVASAESQYSIVHGFGNAVPLAFAVRQIVPPPFRVAYRGPVDDGLLVTWIGGRPWNTALASALRQHGLRLVVAGSTVTIGY